MATDSCSRCAVRLHYIPLSSSYREIYNIHAFFSAPTLFVPISFEGGRVMMSVPPGLRTDQQARLVSGLEMVS
jgi:hypothetical protein